MKISFTFSNKADLSSAIEAEIIKSHFDIPEQALQLPDFKEHVLSIANTIDQLTEGWLFLTCKELNYKNQMISDAKKSDKSIPFNVRTLSISFFRRFWPRNESKILTIAYPVPHPIDPSRVRKPDRRHKTLRSCLMGIKDFKRLEEQEYLDKIRIISDHCLALLHTTPPINYAQKWELEGFHPHWWDYSIAQRWNKLMQKVRAEQRKHERLEQKRLKAQEEGIPIANAKTLQRGHAVPGAFKGVMMRSQLEIRFASELEKRGIRWLYETERLGEGNYLVDFYLPDVKCWVEVKGSFEPRDEYLLPEIADMLERERSEKLYVYSQHKVFLVKKEKFVPLIKEDFWQQISK